MEPNQVGQGLTTEEAGKRFLKFGPNQLARPYEIKFFDIVKEEISEPMMLLLLFVGGVYSVWGKLEDAVTIFLIIFIMIFVEVWNEYKAKKAINALSKLAEPKTRVLRNGQVIQVETEKIVPGDYLVLNPGTRISADGNLLTSVSLSIDESSLTGESLPVSKNAGDEIYAGTLVVMGEGRAEVGVTGAATKFGKISYQAKYIKPPKTPLQLAMKKLSGSLVWVALFFSIAIPLLGLLRGQELKTMVLTGLALSFSVIPEELPFVITLILGLGAYQLSKSRFLVKKLKAAEVLGDTTVILTDKTGTLTEGKMKVAAVYPEMKEKEIIGAAAAVLTEGALFATDEAIANKTMELNLKSEGEIIRERSFDDISKTKAVIRKIGSKFWLFVSGAPEKVLAKTKGTKTEYEKELKIEAAKGRRVVAVAGKLILTKDKDKEFAGLEKNLKMFGLISIEDSPRVGTAEALAQTRQAGIRTIMVTGDHPETAVYIANKLGIEAEKVMTGDEIEKLTDTEMKNAVKGISVFARCNPEHKYRLLQSLQANGEIVAVTGDGVNDTLALKGANIGIAMGLRGTDAAKEAADVVVADDNYQTIVGAIFAGRKFYDNLTKGVSYYLAVKAALVLVFLLPVLVGLPLPFAPIQIILLEMFMDLAASSGFVAEPPEKTIYEGRQQVGEERLMGKKMIINTALSTLSLFVAVMVPYLFALDHYGLAQAQTIAFVAWMVGHVVLAFVSRSMHEPLIKLGLFTNKVMNLWAVGVILLLIVSMVVPAIGSQLKIMPISFSQVSLILGIVLIAIVWREIVKYFGEVK